MVQARNAAEAVQVALLRSHVTRDACDSKIKGCVRPSVRPAGCRSDASLVLQYQIQASTDRPSRNDRTNLIQVVTNTSLTRHLICG